MANVIDDTLRNQDAVRSQDTVRASPTTQLIMQNAWSQTMQAREIILTWSFVLVPRFLPGATGSWLQPRRIYVASIVLVKLCMVQPDRVKAALTIRRCYGAFYQMYNCYCLLRTYQGGGRRGVCAVVRQFILSGLCKSVVATLIVLPFINIPFTASKLELELGVCS